MATLKTNHVQLGYLGLVPFLALTGWHFMAKSPLVVDAFVVYSISILCFVAGSLWKPEEQSNKTAWLVVLPTLALPLSVLVSDVITLVWLAANFVFVLMLQKRGQDWSTQTKDYQVMRERVTSVVFVCHLFLMAQINHTLA
jgi:hypothetical protein